MKFLVVVLMLSDAINPSERDVGSSTISERVLLTTSLRTLSGLMILTGDPGLLFGNKGKCHSVNSL